jgi:hypothetical protein
MSNGKAATFWHVISDGAVEEDRLPNLARCSRVPWIRPMIESVGSDRVLWWGQSRSGDNRSVVALPDFSYKIVIANRVEYCLLWTAFVVDHQHQRDKTQREYEEYWRARK